MAATASVQEGAGSIKTIQSVTRALDILEYMARQRGEVSLASISEALGLNVSTCHHLIKTLVARNYIRPGPVVPAPSCKR
jgi:IclR family acetate operon transcriptional repressor